VVWHENEFLVIRGAMVHRFAQVLDSLLGTYFHHRGIEFAGIQKKREVLFFFKRPRFNGSDQIPEKSSY
jgi:hypothetical protein